MTDSGAASPTGRPLCRCHGKPMTRRNDRPSGWRCSVKHATANNAWRAANPEWVAAERYAQARARLRARIARKRALIEELETQ